MDAMPVNLCVVSQDHSDPKQIERTSVYVARMLENRGIADSGSFKIICSTEAFHQDIVNEILGQVRIEDHRRQELAYKSIPCLLLDDHRVDPTPRDYLDVLTRAGLFVERFVWRLDASMLVVLTYRFPSIMMHKYLIGEMEWKPDDIYEMMPVRLYEVQGEPKTARVVYEMPSE